MIISADQLREAIRKVLPDIQFIWPQSTTYYLPTLAELEAALAESKVSAFRFDGELVDCDYFSLEMNCFIKHRRAQQSDQLPAAEQYHWAFGECSGNRINRQDLQHTLNICLTQSGLVLVEPQTYEYWAPVKGNDSIQVAKI